MKPAVTVLFAMLMAVAGFPARAADDPLNGERLAQTHCARCHVIGSFNRLGGIDSTPSFATLLTLPDADNRFETFFARRPHPVFVRIPDNPRPSKLPPNAAAVPLSLQELSDLLAYVATLK